MRCLHCLAVGWVALTACAGNGITYLLDGGSATTGGSTATSSGTGAATQGASSGSEGGSSSSTGSSSTGGGPPPCVWVNDVCATANCTNAAADAPCALPDGGQGGCRAGTCVSVNLKTDPVNCGGYGYTCPPGVPCTDGYCSVPNQFPDCADGGGCPPNDSCVRAGPGAVCVSNDCAQASDDDACVGSSGAYLNFCCHGQCISSNDVANCGGCGTTCAPGTACWNGECFPTGDCTANRNGYYDLCTLPTGAAGNCCSGQCVDLNSDPNHCGYCYLACPLGRACSPAGCTGSCSSSSDCPSGFSCIEGECIFSNCDVSSDGVGCTEIDGGSGTCCGGTCIGGVGGGSANCEGCGIDCPPGQTCVGGDPALFGGNAPRFGTCVVVTGCPEGTYGCALDGGALGYCCGNRCMDLSSDPNNCGGCGFPCPTGDTCSNDGCVDDAGGQGLCAVNADCPAGTACAYGSCMPSICSEESP